MDENCRRRQIETEYGQSISPTAVVGCEQERQHGQRLTHGTSGASARRAARREPACVDLDPDSFLRIAYPENASTENEKDGE